MRRCLAATMGQIIKGLKKNQQAIPRITIQVESDEGDVQVLEVDDAVEKSEEKARAVVVEQNAEYCNTKHVSILERIKQLHHDSHKVAKMDHLADERRKELENLLKYDPEF